MKAVKFSVKFTLQ